MTLSEAVYAADEIRRIPRGELMGKVNHRHHKPFQGMSPADWHNLTAVSTDEIHVGSFSYYTVIDSRLFWLYTKCNELGFKIDVGYAWRPGLSWYYCEPCRKVFYTHETNQACESSPFPPNKWPSFSILNELRNAGLL